jgi:hypothetical protein
MMVPRFGPALVCPADAIADDNLLFHGVKARGTLQ